MADCHTQAHVIRSALSHMAAHLTSTQQPTSRLLDGRGATAHGGGHALDRGAPAPGVVNETKVGIVAVMRELDRATTSDELYAIWGRRKPIAVFDYHLSTLVRAGVAEIISGPELCFRLLRTKQERLVQGIQERQPMAPVKLGHT